MNIFEQYLHERFLAELRSWTAEILRDMYILVLDIGFSCDDVRAANFGLRYNTHANWKIESARAFSPNEAQWNSAYWLSSPLQICKQPFIHEQILDENNVDWRGVGLRDAYYTFAGDHLSHDPVNNIVDACAHVVRQLHQSGDVAALCGHAVPIVIEIGNDFNCDEYLSQKVKEVNPPELLAGYFSIW